VGAGVGLELLFLELGDQSSQLAARGPSAVPAAQEFGGAGHRLPTALVDQQQLFLDADRPHTVSVGLGAAAS
jgi:hypothetical protein